MPHQGWISKELTA